VLAIFAGAFWLIQRTIHSPFGQILKAIRENEPRAISLGYDVAKYKLLAFVLSAGLAGLAGATKTLVFKFATLTDAHWHTSGEVVLMTLLGGMGTVFRPGGRRHGDRHPAERTGRQGRLAGHGHHGRDLRRLRAGLPPRHRRRIDRALPAHDGQKRYLSYLKDLNHRAPALVVRRLKTLGELHGCQALYLDSANAAKLPAVLGASAKRPLLIITDFDAGAMQGAAVSLVATGSGRFGFDVNLKAARSVGLDFNARLLQLARKVF
jgi:hypothetical protein